MKWTPHDERPEAVKIYVDALFVADFKSAYPESYGNWGANVASRRTPLGYMYDVVVPPTMEEAMLPEELR